MKAQGLLEGFTLPDANAFVEDHAGDGAVFVHALRAEQGEELVGGFFGGVGLAIGKGHEQQPHTREEVVFVALVLRDVFLQQARGSAVFAAISHDGDVAAEGSGLAAGEERER